MTIWEDIQLSRNKERTITYYNYKGIGSIKIIL